MAWYWILLIVVGALLALLATLSVLSLSAARGGFGMRVIKGLTKLLWRFKPTRRLILKLNSRMLESGRLEDAAAGLGGGLDARQAREAQQLLSSLSEEGREKLIEKTMQLDDADVSDERKQELMREATGVLVEDLNLGRAQRRALERAQAKQTARQSRPAPSASAGRPGQKGQKRKKRS